jgi:hypothetical protein
MNKSHTASDDSPQNHDEREEKARSRSGEDDIGWNFEGNIGDEEYNKTDRVLVGCQLEITSHPCNFGVANAVKQP